MSLGSFTKDKVANKFGIQLKNPSETSSDHSTPVNNNNNNSAGEEESAAAAVMTKRVSLIPPVIPNKSEAQIEHQKDQPLYKRQLSKTLDNGAASASALAAATLKNKHSHELSKG